MSDVKDQWVGMYYPDYPIDSPRSKTILGLLFDSVICHIPISDMDCGGGSGASQIFEDDLLVEEGVIEFREEFFLPGMDPKSSPEHFWGNDEDLEQFQRLQVSGYGAGSL